MSKNLLQLENKERGAALLLSVVLFLAVSLGFSLTIGKSAYEDIAKFRSLREGKEAFYAAEAGVEDAIYRYRRNMQYSASETFLLNDVTVTTVRTLRADYVDLLTTANKSDMIRNNAVTLGLGTGVSFSYGIQSGTGGIAMSNNSRVYGNLYSNGTIVGQGLATIGGNIISAGSGGRVETIHATGSVFAHTIDSATVDGDAYYYATATKIATIVGGASHPGTPDQLPIPLPISDEQIEAWKYAVATSGTLIASTSPECLSGTYTINSNTTLGNIKIECDVIFEKQGASTMITLTGPVWISGNLSFNQGPTIVASSSLGSKSVQIIVDKESDRLTSSKVTINQSTEFTTGNNHSYVMILSMNNSAESGGTEKAINLAQSANGKVLVYAGHGLIEMGNNISLKEVTGYQINISNGSEVTYESGLTSLLFTNGPGGGYTVTSWKEVE